MKLQALYTALLSLSVCSVYASLPYSIPDLEHNRLFHRDIPTSASSWKLPLSTSASLHLSAGTASDPSSHLKSHTLVLSGSSYRTEPAWSSGQHILTTAVPFPTTANTTTVSRGTGGVVSDSYLSSTLSRYTSRTLLNTNTTSRSAIDPIQTLPPSLSSRFTNSTITLTSSKHLAANNTVVIVTVTPTGGSPIIITKTVVLSSSSSLSASSAVRPTTTTRLAPQDTSARSPFLQTSLSGAVQLPSGGGISNSMLPNLPRPSQTPGNNEKPRIQFPAPFFVDAVIDGIAYHLPYPNEPPIEIMLLDGSIAQLLAGKVVLRGQTLNIPADIPSTQPISVGGQSITAKPAEVKKPDSNDHDGGQGGGGGGGGPFAFLKKLVGAAGSAAKAIGDVATGAAGFATGAAGTGGATAKALSGTISNAISGANGVVSSLNGIQKAFPLDTLTKAGMDTFLNAQNMGRSSLDWMQSTSKMLDTFDSLKPEVQQQVRDNIRAQTKPGGLLQQAGDAMKGLSEFLWESEAPTTNLPSPTATPKPTDSAQGTKSVSIQSSRAGTSTSARTTSTTASSSSATPASTEQPLPYYIITKWGTPVDVFNKFVSELDGGVGKADSQKNKQTYKTNLTSSQADGLEAKYPFLLLAYADVSYPEDIELSGEEFHAIPRTRGEPLAPTVLNADRKHTEKQTVPLEQPVLPRAPISGGENAPHWKKMISSPFQQPPLRPTSEDPPYAADDSGGRGTTIYVMDDGFDINSPELAASGRTVDTFFVDNDDAFAPNFLEFSARAVNRPNAFLVDAQLGGGTGHGTKMATIAAGKTHGIAPNANLYLLKTKGQWNTGKSEGEADKNASLQPKALSKVMQKIREHIQDRLDADKDAKSVINMSWGVEVRASRAGPLLEKIFPEFLAWLESVKVPIILAAGNDPTMWMHEQVPHKFGTPDNMIITVGGVEKDGTLFRDTTPVQPGEAGSMSVYAPARDVVVPSPGNDIHYGTSQAAAIVSGMVAYLYSAPGIGMINHPDVPRPDENIKKFIVAHAWTRVPASRLGTFTSLDVVYNLAYGDTEHPQNPCAIQFGKRDTEPASACSLVQSSTSSRGVSTSSMSTRTSSSTSTSATISELATSPLSSSPASSQAPTLPLSPSSSINIAPVPTPPTNPQSEKCRIYVNEFDHTDPNNHGEEIWNVNIYPDTGVGLRDNVQICMTGTDGDEHTGVDVKCEPIGNDVFHLQREKDDLLRFIWGTQTWTAKDARCKTVKNWYQHDPTQADKRKRETECKFECKIDWSKPPTMIIT